MKSFSDETIESVIEDTCTNLVAFCRDANLGELGDLYVPGQIIREMAFIDASSITRGIITTHRYFILSNHMVSLSSFEHGTNWCLCVGQCGSRFQVLDVYKTKGHTQILLLHLPEKNWEVFEEVDISKAFKKAARKRFDELIDLPPAKELTTEAWLTRCDFPLGMSDDGEFYPIEDMPD